MAISKYLEMLITGEPPDDEPPPDPPDHEKTTGLTQEQEAICDRAEAYAKKAKPGRRGFAIKKLSKSYQKAIKLNRSDEMSDSS